LALAGCSSPAPRTYSAADERPKCTEDARWWEQKAMREIEIANRSDREDLRIRHIDFAIRDLKEARNLFYDELLSQEREATRDKPIPAGRRAALDAQIDRLQREIDQTYVDRPVTFEH
jgi:hypothetical protein